jgi:anti-sigma factor RsiW
MTCHEFSSRLMAFVSGDLAEAEQRRLQRHARQCPLCAEEVDSYQRVIRLGHLLPLIDPPPEILDRLRAAVRDLEIAPQPATNADELDLESGG